MNKRPRYTVKADDQGMGTVYVFVEKEPFDHDPVFPEIARRNTQFTYGEDTWWSRRSARAAALDTAQRWAFEIAHLYPCTWTTSWRKEP